MPHIDTFATPGTDNNAGRMFQRASTDIWMGETCFEESPTIMTRLVADMGWRITGGFAPFWQAYAQLKGPLTKFPGRKKSGPSWEKRADDEKPGGDPGGAYLMKK